MNTFEKFRYLDFCWSPAEFHENLIGCLNEAYVAACRDNQFGGQHGVPSAPTFWQQEPLLGRSKLARESSGLLKFAKRYVAAEAKGGATNVIDRWTFERFCDFAMFSKHNPPAVQKRPIMLAEVRLDTAELLDGLTNLLTIRAPFKYLFVGTQSNTRDQLNTFCAHAPANGSSDWPGTIINVIEIPTDQAPPSAWNSLRAIANDANQLEFASL